MPDPEMPTMFVPVECDERNPEGYIAKAWNLDTGRPMFTNALGTGGASELSLSPCTGLLILIYHGDTGLIESGKVIRRGDDTAEFTAFAGGVDETRRRAAEVMEARMASMFEVCVGDPDKLCPLCDDGVPGDATITPADCHRECAMANVIGHYGALVDPDFWCENMNDPYAGLGSRGSALAVAKLVNEHGLYAVATRNFPKPETQPSGAGDG